MAVSRHRSGAALTSNDAHTLASRVEFQQGWLLLEQGSHLGADAVAEGCGEHLPQCMHAEPGRLQETLLQLLDKLLRGLTSELEWL